MKQRTVAILLVALGLLLSVVIPTHTYMTRNIATMRDELPGMLAWSGYKNVQLERTCPSIEGGWVEFSGRDKFTLVKYSSKWELKGGQFVNITHTPTHQPNPEVVKAYVRSRQHQMHVALEKLIGE